MLLKSPFQVTYVNQFHQVIFKLYNYIFKLDLKRLIQDHKTLKKLNLTELDYNDIDSLKYEICAYEKEYTKLKKLFITHKRCKI